MSYRERKPLNKKSIVALILAALVVVAAIIAMNVYDNWHTITGDTGESADATYNIEGVKCYKKQNVETYLLMGIDTSSDDTVKKSVQSDTNILLIMDRSAKTYRTFHIDRNTMVQVPFSNGQAGDATTGVMQLSLAYAMGDLKEGSCEKVEDSISNLLYDQRIDGYISLNLDSIQGINNLLGGVEVTIQEEDLAKIDPALEKGKTVRLTDEQAETFVRSRKGVEGGANTNRMDRQRQYMDAASEAFISKMKSDDNFVDEALEVLGSDMLTDISKSDLNRIAGTVSDGEKLPEPEVEASEIISKNTGWIEATYDRNSLAKAVIELFYKPVDKSQMVVLDIDDEPVVHEEAADDDKAEAEDKAEDTEEAGDN